MKKLSKFIGIFALTALIVFSMAGCDGGSSDSTDEAVTLASGSDGTAGNAKVTGLTAGKYYIVVEGANISYAKADGTLTTALKDIAALTGTEITGLDNTKTYKVNAAAVFAPTGGNVSLHDYAEGWEEDGLSNLAVTNGVIKIETLGEELWSVDLKLNLTKEYEIMKVKTTGESTAWTESRTSALYNWDDDDDGEDPFTPHITGKTVSIYIWAEKAEPDWMNGTSMLYVQTGNGSADYIIRSVDGSYFSVLTIVVDVDDEE